MAGDAAGATATDRARSDPAVVDRAAADAAHHIYRAEQHEHDAGGSLEHDRTPAHARITKQDQAADDSVDGADSGRSDYHAVFVPVRHRKFQAALRASGFADAAF